MLTNAMKHFRFGFTFISVPFFVLVPSQFSFDFKEYVCSLPCAKVYWFICEEPLTAVPKHNT